PPESGSDGGSIPGSRDRSPRLARFQRVRDRIGFTDIYSVALSAHPDDERDRGRVRDGAAEVRRAEREREPGGVPGDGRQAEGVGIEGLALLDGCAAAGRGHQGDGLHRRNAGEARRLRILQTQLLTIPRLAAKWLVRTQPSRSSE